MESLSSGTTRHGSATRHKTEIHVETDLTSSHDAEFNVNSTGEYLVNDFIVGISQILCFPFAIDSNEETIGQTYKIIKELNLFNRLLSACVSNYSSGSGVSYDVPMSLISRLILTDENLVLLLIDQLNNSPKVILY